MASTHFKLTPTSGSAGTTTVSVSAATTNTGTVDKAATATFINGDTRTTVSLSHKFKPYITQGPTSIPASGGSITVYVYSEYDIVFRSVPLWITISSGNTTYSEGQRISASSLGTLPASFTLTASSNGGAERTIQYEGMNVCHYIGNTLMTQYACTVTGTQAAGSISTSVSELTYNWSEVTGKTFTVTSSVNWNSSIADN